VARSDVMTSKFSLVDARCSVIVPTWANTPFFSKSSTTFCALLHSFERAYALMHIVDHPETIEVCMAMSTCDMAFLNDVMACDILSELFLSQSLIYSKLFPALSARIDAGKRHFPGDLLSRHRSGW
jgi:hypothetical protein